jgi:hypothetical protein
MNRLFAAFVLLIVAALPAHAAISEIRMDFLNQTSLLAATPFLSPPAITANYLVCIYLDQPGSENAMTAVLRWTDENSLPQSFTFAAKMGPINFCNPIRNLAGTAPTIETDGAYPGSYELFVTGFGFWPGATPQSQGGITEPIHRDFINGYSGVLLTPAATGDYLVAISLGEGGQWSLSWTDFIGLQTITSSSPVSGSAIPIHVLAGTDITFHGGGSDEPAYVEALHFGTPAAGAGPVTDFEFDMIDYTDVKWPKYVPVLTSYTPGMYVSAGNMARVPDTGGAPVLEFFGDTLFLQILDVTASGAPGTNGIIPPPYGIVGAGYRNGSADNPFTFSVTTAVNNPGTGPAWGESGTFSAEVDVIKF